MVDFGLSGMTQYLVKFVINPLMWLILIVIFVGGALLILYIRRRRRLVYPVAEIVDLGCGKTNINTDMMAGYFGRRSYLKGLWWTGEEIVKTTFGDIIEYASTEDFQEVNGRRGFVCYRDPVRRNVLLPVSRLNVVNKELVAMIAPADFTDVAVDIIKDSVAETSDWRDRMIQFGAWAMVVIFSLVAIIVIVKMVESGQEKANDLMLNANEIGAERCANVCGEAFNVVFSSGKVRFSEDSGGLQSFASSAP